MVKKTLIIVESPAKAKTISKFLGKNFKIAASMGHIRDLPKSQFGIDIDDNFKPRYINIRGKGKIIEQLKKEASTAANILLATDPDREGEAISWHIANLLNLEEDDSIRIEFHEITKNAVIEAIKKPRPIDKNLVDAQQARRVLDRIVGYKLSPLLWKKIKGGLSAGRVQSVATRIICDRELEIKNFKPEEYWTLEILAYDLKDRETKVTVKFYGDINGKIDLKSKEDVDRIIQVLENTKLKVIEIKKFEKKRNSPFPFITSTLQQEAYKRLGFTSKKTMMIAQELYEGIEIKDEGFVGLITYLRTDSVRVAEEAQKSAREYIALNYGKEYVGNYRAENKKKNKIQDAHEAIRPTSIFREPDKIRGSLTDDQYKLYKLIWERFIASQMAPAVYDGVSIQLESQGYVFKASGSVLKFPGYLTIYKFRDEEDEGDKEIILPEFQEGDELIIEEFLPKQHFTEPPPRYTEASLIKFLEEKGIGRPSTYAPIISTILERGYVVRQNRNLVPTELGFLVTDIMKEYFPDIVDIGFTAELESKLDEIEDGERFWVDIVKEFYNDFEKLLEKAEKDIQKIDIDEVSEEKCEICGRNMVVKKGRFGKFLACPGYPECKNTKPIIERLKVLCPKCQNPIVVKKSKKGRNYYRCENVNCDFISWYKPVERSCKNCGSIMVEKRSKGKITYQCISCEYREE